MYFLVPEPWMFLETIGSLVPSTSGLASPPTVQKTKRSFMRISNFICPKVNFLLKKR